MRSIWKMAALAAAAAVVGARADAAVVPAPGFIVRTYPTPDTVQGGVIRRGNALFVGQGTFGSGGERIVRLDGAVATTIATGFSSLAGFELDGTTLYAVDNCFGSDFGCGSPTTGDTLYAVTDATTRTTAVTAPSSEVLPSGTFSTPQDVLAVPGGVLVSDAVGVGAGRVVKVVGTTVTNLATGLDFLGGLATDGATLFVANVDGSFAGSVRKYTLAGGSLGTLVGGLSGAYAVASDGAGNVLVTGGFTGDFSSSTLLAVNGAGMATERAHGFAFSSEVFYDAARATALVLDFGVAEVTAICADADGNAVCDADCAAPAAVGRAKLKVGRQLTPPGDDTLGFKGEMTVPTSPAIDPVANGVHVLVDDFGGRVIVDVAVPGGAYDPLTRTGWRTNGAGNTWLYKSQSGVVVITKVKVKSVPAVPGLVKFTVTGKHGSYDTGAAALPLQAVLSLNPSFQCGRASFTGTGLSCARLGGGSTVSCK